MLNPKNQKKIYDKLRLETVSNDQKKKKIKKKEVLWNHNEIV